MSSPLLEAHKVSISARGGDKQVRDHSLYVRPGEIIALIGLGKGDLRAFLRILSGYRKPSEGQVLVAGEDLYKIRRGFHPNIGFVPRGVPIHQLLTVFETLYYSARLRLPRGTTRAARRQRVDEVLADLELIALRDSHVRDLSGEQQKRVSIAVELLTNPGILFLDDPSFGLPPDGETGLMRVLRKLAGQGRGIILTTQSLNNIGMVDRIGITLSGGYQAWFGPADEALAFFTGSDQPSTGDGKLRGFAQVSDSLGNAGESEAQQWAERYQAHPAYKRYLLPAQGEKQPGILLEERPLARMREKPAAAVAPAAYKVSALGQFFALSARGMKLILRDRLALVLLLAAPLVAASLDLIFTDGKMYDLTVGSSEKIVLSSAMLVFLAMLVAGFYWTREVRKEAATLHRERQASLKLWPYVLSKVWMVALFALYQGLVWTLFHFLIVNVPGGWGTRLAYFFTLASVALVGGILGLVASALARSVGGAGLLVFVFVLPQLFLSGVLGKFPEPGSTISALNWINPVRQAFEALIIAGGHLKSLSGDVCLLQTEDVREALSEEQKARSCTCLGAGLFSRCNFPGIRAFYVPEVDEDSPPPFKYQDLLDLVQGMSQEQIESQLEGLYLSINSFIQRQVEWRTARSTAITSAESLIESEYDRYRDILYGNLSSRWTALWASAAVLTVIFAGVLKREEEPK